jgi:hypothetical protein
MHDDTVVGIKYAQDKVMSALLMHDDVIGGFRMPNIKLVGTEQCPTCAYVYILVYQLVVCM